MKGRLAWKAIVPSTEEEIYAEFGQEVNYECPSLDFPPSEFQPEAAFQEALQLTAVSPSLRLSHRSLAHSTSKFSSVLSTVLRERTLNASGPYGTATAGLKSVDEATPSRGQENQENCDIPKRKVRFEGIQALPGLETPLPR